VAAEDSFGPLLRESQDSDPGFYDALKIIVAPEKHAPRASHTEDILLWHTQQVRHHFIQHALPLLSACESNLSAAEVLVGSIHTLEAAHRQYLYGLHLILRMLDETASQAALRRFRHDLHAIIGNSMTPALIAALRAVLRRLLRISLKMPRTGTRTDEADVSSTRGKLLDLVESLHKVGLAGERFQVLFAEMMDGMMAEYINTTYARLWSSDDERKKKQRKKSPPESRPLRPVPSLCIADLNDWIEDYYSRIAFQVLSCLGVGQIAWADVEKWKEIAVGRLATLRINELFDIVLHWPDSKGGLDDLRSSVTTPQRRLQLTDALSESLQRRLLHPGCSTLKILRVYISLIRTFHALDSSKVLLDRVVHSLQLYLCQRDDAVRIVVTGLLSNPEDTKSEIGQTKLADLAVLLNDPAQSRRQAPDDEDLEWDDMEWMPIPADASANYKRPKSEDVIGTLINALGSQDVFIKEFQSIIGERLLSRQVEFQQETKVLKLLKKRFGEHALQNCDVMIKDIQDSRRVDAAICKAIVSVQGAPESTSLPPIYHTKILSRLFWPNIVREHFLVPAPVLEVQAQYGRGYEQLKSSRKLTWLDHLGTAGVRLTLSDRVVDLECKTYQAAVIYAFGDDESEAETRPVRLTATDLEEKLQMDIDLVEEALSFWAHKTILQEMEDGTFTVLETRDESAPPGTPSAASPVKASSSAADALLKKPKRTMNAKEKEQRQMYWQFIVGMLTNSAASMGLGQIFMILKTMIPGGFPWSNEELQEFLADKVLEEELEITGGKYKLPRK
jgi:anaphase-promoting complex subunit 2